MTGGGHETAMLGASEDRDILTIPQQMGLSTGDYMHSSRQAMQADDPAGHITQLGSPARGQTPGFGKAADSPVREEDTMRPEEQRKRDEERQRIEDEQDEEDEDPAEPPPEQPPGRQGGRQGGRQPGRQGGAYQPGGPRQPVGGPYQPVGPRQTIIERVIPPPQQAAIIPVVHGVGRQEVRDKGINIKISQKQVMNEKTKRKSKPSELKKARKLYNSLKRETIKAIRKGKSEHYRRENEKIKNLPTKQRKSSRNALRKKLKARETELIRRLPSASKMKLNDLQRVTGIARKLKW
jgi:hypothetical protein